MIYILNMVLTTVLVFCWKIHCLTSEFHVNFHLKNRYRTNCEAMSAMSYVRVKFNVEFTRQAVSFSIRYCHDYMYFDKYQLDQDLHSWHLIERNDLL